MSVFKLIMGLLMLNRGDIAIFAGTSSEESGQEICDALNEICDTRDKNLREKRSEKKLNRYEKRELRFIRDLNEDTEGKGIQLGKREVRWWDESECNVIIDENVRGKDVFLVQNMFDPTKEWSIPRNFIETLIFIDALLLSKARNINLILPYYPFGRQDKQHARDAISAALAARVYTAAGANNLITMDLHANQIVGFFDPRQCKVEHLHSSPLHINYFLKNLPRPSKVAAADAGNARLAEHYAKCLETGLAYSYKKRDYTRKDTVETLEVLGDVEHCAIASIDDLIKSGETLGKLATRLVEKGASKVHLGCTHPLLTGEATETFSKLYDGGNGPLAEVVVCDTIRHPPEYLDANPWLTQLPTADIFALAIYEVHSEGSITGLFATDSEKMDERLKVVDRKTNGHTILTLQPSGCKE